MIVVSAVNGSKNAVSTSGISIISDLCMGCHASIELPSNGIPLKESLLIAFILYDTWCHVPLRSVKRKSTNLTSFSSQYSKNSSTLLTNLPIGKLLKN